MSSHYRAIDWNRQKRIYDLALAGIVAGVMALFVTISLVRSPEHTAETLLLRATALAAILLLHVILAIGPLARLDRRFLPLLYNRRHLGVTLFLLALIHAAVAIVQFHALGDENPLVSVFTAYRRDYPGVGPGQFNPAHLPFEPFGAIALVIFFLMAATSHDFWLRQLGAGLWKALHLGVYAAYGLIQVHVAFGALQGRTGVATPALLGIGFLALLSIHCLAARRERRIDSIESGPAAEGFVDACGTAELSEGRGKVVTVDGRRLAVFLHQGRAYATSNVCRHQGGPLGEGRIVDGCITCPWHGWNYQPTDGCSPPPFTERVETHDTRVAGTRVWIRVRPNPPGTRCPGSPATPLSHE